MNNRVLYGLKNFMWSTLNTFAITVLNFIIRSVFIVSLGTSYLGVNGLFTNILGMLSLAELGLGSAISFKLYKPLSDNNNEKIKSLILFYKKAYQMVALAITLIGIILIPFLPSIAQGADPEINLTLVYLMFLFNTVTSYLLTFRTVLLNADQRNYLFTRINLIFSVITLVFQLVVLTIYNDYYLYLITACAIGLIKNVYFNYFTLKQYPFLKEKNIAVLSKIEVREIISKIKALMFHKIGDVCINQTDSIITSSFINVTIVGVVSNYTLIINTLNTLILGFFNAFTAGLGNLMVTESKEKNFKVYQIYDFLAFCFFGFCSIELYFLLSHFISIWIGDKYILSQLTIGLICANFYLMGLRVPLGNIKQVAGLFEPDRYSPVIQSIINLVISIIGAIYIGLPGIYIGTICSSLVPNIWRPIIVYSRIFHVSSKKYFFEFVKRLLIVIISIVIINLIFEIIGFQFTIVNFFIKGMIIMTVFLLLIILFYHSNSEIKNPLIGFIKRRSK